MGEQTASLLNGRSTRQERLGALHSRGDGVERGADLRTRAHQHSAGAQKKTVRIKPSADPAAG
jgi:hypothetical protein